MKLAVCLFGNVGISKDASERSKEKLFEESTIADTDPEICFENIKNFFLDKYETDVFIHSWSKNYENSLKNLYDPKSSKFEEQIIFNPTLEEYGINKKLEINDWMVSDIAKKSYNLLLPSRIDKQGVLDDLESLSFRSHSRWYSTKESIKLMSEFSKSTNTNYDFVLSTRIDCLFKKELDLNNLDNNKFYASFRKGRDDENIALYDFFFLSNQKKMEDFSELYDCIYEYSIRPPFASMEHAIKIASKENIVHLLDYREDYDKVREIKVPEKNNLIRKILKILFNSLNIN